jgi:hypothetical protein
MTYSELVTLIKQYLENEETSFVDNIPIFVKLTEEDVYRQVQLPVLRKTTTSLSFTATNNRMTIPTDYLSTYSFSVIVSGSAQFLQQKDQSFIREIYPDATVTGTPRYYAQYDDTQFIVAPTPSSGFSTELNYFFKPESIVVTETSWLGTNAESALLFGSLYHGYIYMKGDQDVANMYKEQYSRAVDNLKKIAEGRNNKDTYRTSDSRIPT